MGMKIILCSSAASRMLFRDINELVNKKDIFVDGKNVHVVYGDDGLKGLGGQHYKQRTSVINLHPLPETTVIVSVVCSFVRMHG
jgi:hypothetical protein